MAALFVFVAPADLLVLKHVNISSPCGAAVCTTLRVFSHEAGMCSWAFSGRGGLIFVRQLWANKSLFITFKDVCHIQGCLIVTFMDVCHVQGCLSRSGVFVTFRDVCHVQGCLSHSGMFVTFRDVCHVQGCLSRSGVSVTFRGVCHVQGCLSRSGVSVSEGV